MQRQQRVHMHGGTGRSVHMQRCLAEGLGSESSLRRGVLTHYLCAAMGSNSHHPLRGLTWVLRPPAPDGASLPVSDPDSLEISEDRGRSLFSRAWHGVMDSGSPAVAFARAFGMALALGLGLGIAFAMPMTDIIAFKYFAMGHVTGVAVAVGLAQAATRRQQQLAASAGRRRERELEAHARRLEPHPIWEWPQHWVMLGPCHAWSYGGGAPGSHSAFAAAPHEAFRRELNTRWAVIAGTYDGAVMPLGPMLQDFDGCLDEVVCYMGPSLNDRLEFRYAEFAVGRRDGGPSCCSV